MESKRLFFRGSNRGYRQPTVFFPQKWIRPYTVIPPGPKISSSPGRALQISGQRFMGPRKTPGISLIHRPLYHTHSIHVCFFLPMHEWLIFMVNLGAYTIHGCYRIQYVAPFEICVCFFCSIVCVKIGNCTFKTVFVFFDHLRRFGSGFLDPMDE